MMALPPMGCSTYGYDARGLSFAQGGFNALNTLLHEINRSFYLADALILRSKSFIAFPIAIGYLNGGLLEIQNIGGENILFGCQYSP